MSFITIMQSKHNIQAKTQTDKFILLPYFIFKKCQEATERAFRIEAGISDISLPLSYERVERVVMFMKCYPRRKAIQRAGLDALLYFARNGNIHIF